MNPRSVELPIPYQFITHWYQPIFDIYKNEVIGYEALMRCRDPYTYSPIDIINHARKQGYCTALDRYLIAKSQSLTKDTITCPLFVNVFPSTLLTPEFLHWWENEGEIVSPIVLEISESEEIKDWDSLKRIVKELQIRGIKIAVDDMGVSHSFFKHWIELCPEYIKLDRYYAHELAINNKKQKIIEYFVRLFDDTTQLILEGIETDEDLEAVKKLGIMYAQGYYFARPAPWESFREYQT